MEANIERIDGDYAILKLADRQELKLPVKMLPSDLSEGGRVWLKLNQAPFLGEESPTYMQNEDGYVGSFKEFLNEVLREDGKTY